jgi:hypothetical protein
MRCARRVFETPVIYNLFHFTMLTFERPPTASGKKTPGQTPVDTGYNPVSNAALYLKKEE